MIRYSTITIAGIIAATGQYALAHGFRLTIDGGNKILLETDDPASGVDPVLGPRMIYKVQSLLGSGSPKSTDHPGYEPVSGFAVGDSISFDVSSKLWYSPGSGDPVPAPAGVSLSISRADLEPGLVSVAGSTAFQSGFEIGTYDGFGLGDFEHQLFYALSASPSVPVGAYAVALKLRGTDAGDVPFVPSQTLVAVFNNGLTPIATFNTVAEQLYAVAVPEPSGLALTLVAVAGLAAVALRRRPK
jgi:hypothetical protein